LNKSRGLPGFFISKKLHFEKTKFYIEKIVINKTAEYMSVLSYEKRLVNHTRYALDISRDQTMRTYDFRSIGPALKDAYKNAAYPYAVDLVNQMMDVARSPFQDAWTRGMAITCGIAGPVSIVSEAETKVQMFSTELNRSFENLGVPTGSFVWTLPHAAKICASLFDVATDRANEITLRETSIGAYGSVRRSLGDMGYNSQAFDKHLKAFGHDRREPESVRNRINALAL
jgi:hypothetical protein